MNRENWEAKLDAKFDTIVENIAAREARSPEQQIQRLDKMFGVGEGAKKERAKLAKQIKNKKESKKEDNNE